jgi:hypothetical protein
VWDVAPTSARFPDWLLLLSEAISGQVLNQKGLLEPTRLNRAEVLTRFGKNWPGSPAMTTGSSGDVGFWQTAPCTPSPHFPSSPCLNTSRIGPKEMTPQSLDEAEQLAVGNPDLLQWISEARRTLNQTK